MGLAPVEPREVVEPEANQSAAPGTSSSLWNPAADLLAATQVRLHHV